MKARLGGWGVNVNGVEGVISSADGQFMIKGSAIKDVHDSADPTVAAKVLAHTLGAGWLPTQTFISGSDPEIFVADATGVVIPAWKFLPAEADAKWDKRELDVSADMNYRAESMVYWDGFQAELKTPGKTTCHVQLVEDIQRGIRSIYDAARKYDPEARLMCRDVVEAPADELMGAAEGHVAFGCNPSLNAYGIQPLDIGDPRQLPIRFSGTHLHGSISPVYNHGTSIEAPPWFPNGMVVCMDKITGLLLTALGRGMEDPRRRRFYGRPGEYRLPVRLSAVAIEYRTPGSFILSSPALMELAFDINRIAFKLGMFVPGEALPIPDVRDIIMNADADAACAVIEAHRPFYKQVLRTAYTSNALAEESLRLITNGAAKLGLGTPERAWGVAGEWLPYNRYPNSLWMKVCQGVAQYPELVPMAQAAGQ